MLALLLLALTVQWAPQGPVVSATRLVVRLEAMPGLGGGTDPARVEVYRIITRSELALVAEKTVDQAGLPADLVFGVDPGAYLARAASRGYWIPDTPAVVPEKGTAKLELRMWPSRLVRVSDAAGVVACGGPPAATFRPVGAEQPRGTQECRQNGGQVVCDIPSLKMDVVLKAPGCIAEYLWGLDNTRQQTLGKRFESGTSLTGFILDAAGERAPGVRVTLRSLEGSTIQDRSGEDSLRYDGALSRPATPAFSATSNHLGFFQIRNPPVGRFRVVAATSEALVAQTDVVVPAGHDSALRDFLRLEKPYRLSIEIQPPTQPNGEAWSVEMTRLTPFSTVSVSQAGADGLATLDGIGRGNYSLAVMADGQSYFRTQVEVEEEPGPVRIALPLLHVDGRVLLRGQPLAARLGFGVPLSRAIRLESNEDGRFEGILPRRRAPWTVAIEAEKPVVRRTLRNVVVEADEADRASLTIGLGEVRLSGRVADRLGVPTQATVTLAPAAPSDDALTQFPTDAGGRFELDGLAPGVYAVDAHASEGRQSDTARVVLGRSDAEVTLVVGEVRETTGRLVSAGGVPVAGAEVLWLPIATPLTVSGRSRTDSDGRFLVRTSPGVRLGAIAYWGTGVPLDVALMPVSAVEERTFPVSTFGGTITVESHDTSGAAQLLVVRNGVTLPLEWFATLRPYMRPGLGDPGPVTIPDVATGPYMVCRGPSSDRQASLAGTAGRGCAQGMLTPGGKLPLSLAEDAAMAK